jgi:Tol biopolymer transport system component
LLILAGHQPFGIMKNLIIIFLSLVFCLPTVNAQPDAASAKQKFSAGQYDAALLDYLKLLEKDPKNVEFNMNAAQCYLDGGWEKCKALPFLETVVAQPNFDKSALFHLARAQAYCGKHQDASDSYKKLLAEPALPAGLNKADIEHRMDWCKNAAELMKKPLKVSFENLGPAVNSPFADYSPFVSYHEDFLIFNSRRPDAGGTLKPNGDYTSDVFISQVKDGKWQSPESIGDVINTPGEEEVVGLCADGNTAIFRFDNTSSKGDILVGPKLDNQFLAPFKVNPNVNSAAMENGASISPDGKTLYFASNREGGLGGFDIYRTQILPNGEWGEAYNLGPNINTPYDEDYPTISFDGQTLYFSSKGHNSMGEFDIFKTQLMEDGINFGPAANVGYPVNTPGDDKNLCMNEKGRYGYFSTIRKDSQGDLDIYRVTFKEVESELTVVKGTVKSANPAAKLPPVTIEVIDAKSNDTYGQYKANPNTGKYVVILPPGSYYLQVDAPGFKSFSENIQILDKGSYVPSMDKDILLQSK